MDFIPKDTIVFPSKSPIAFRGDARAASTSGLQALRSAAGQLEQLAEVTPRIVRIECKDPWAFDRVVENAQESFGHVESLYHKDCTQPVSVVWACRESGVPAWDRSVRTVSGTVRCRKCDACVRARGRMWTARAIDECARHGRNWFCTFTFNWTKVPEGADKLRWAGRQLTLFFKRLRKGGGKHAPAKFRYLAVFERHRNGTPHIHVLIHCISNIQYRSIARAWGANGFMNAKIIAEGPTAARYVCKYLYKSGPLGARQRASALYGRAGQRTSQVVPDYSEQERPKGPRPDSSPALLPRWEAPSATCEQKASLPESIWKREIHSDQRMLDREKSSETVEEARWRTTIRH